jgi:hypothetical protein
LNDYFFRNELLTEISILNAHRIVKKISLEKVVGENTNNGGKDTYLIIK